MNEFVRELAGYRLTLFEITYRMPDHKALLQTFLWQILDLPPKFPGIQNFLDFWERELAEAPIHSVRLATTSLVGLREFRISNTVLTLPSGNLIH